MPFNPFNSNSEGSSFEQGNPLANAVKKKVQDTSAAAVQQAKQQSQSFTDQLYGNVIASSEESLDANGVPAASQNSKPVASYGNTQASLAQQAALAKTPQEQAQIEEARKKLQELTGQHKSSKLNQTENQMMIFEKQ